MNRIARVMAATALAVCGLAARAETLGVTLSGTLDMPPLTAGPTLATLSFTIDVPVNAIQQSQGTSMLLNVPVQASFVNGAGTGVADVGTTSIGWFGFPDLNYFGIDVRLSDLLVPGDVMQFIWTLPAPGTTGPDTTPTIVQQTLDGRSGVACYYATGSGACTSTSPFSDGRYSVAAVPEPAAALMLLPGLALLVWRRRRQPAGLA